MISSSNHFVAYPSLWSLSFPISDCKKYASCNQRCKSINSLCGLLLENCLFPLAAGYPFSAVVLQQYDCNVGNGGWWREISFTRMVLDLPAISAISWMQLLFTLEVSKTSLTLPSLLQFGETHLCF